VPTVQVSRTRIRNVKVAINGSKGCVRKRSWHVWKYPTPIWEALGKTSRCLNTLRPGTSDSGICENVPVVYAYEMCSFKCKFDTWRWPCTVECRLSEFPYFDYWCS
jgi:hypothetical protein